MGRRSKIETDGNGVNSGPVDVRRRARSDEQTAALLNTALRRRDTTAFLGALNLAVKAHGYSAVAQKTGLIIDSGSATSTVVAGLYADSGGKPGTLLTQGTLNSTAAGVWNTVNVPSV